MDAAPGQSECCVVPHEHFGSLSHGRPRLRPPTVRPRAWFIVRDSFHPDSPDEERLHRSADERPCLSPGLAGLSALVARIILDVVPDDKYGNDVAEDHKEHETRKHTLGVHPAS